MITLSTIDEVTIREFHEFINAGHFAFPLCHGHALEIIAALNDFNDWNELSQNVADIERAKREKTLVALTPCQDWKKALESAHRSFEKGRVKQVRLEDLCAAFIALGLYERLFAGRPHTSENILPSVIFSPPSTAMQGQSAYSWPQCRQTECMISIAIIGR